MFVLRLEVAMRPRSGFDKARVQRGGLLPE